MNRQEVFDTVVTHLRTQGKPARTITGTCRYRMEDPNSGEVLRCAIGCLIPDELYSPRMEGSGIITLILNAPYSFAYKLPEVLRDTTEEDRVFLQVLQNVHDNRDFWDENGLNGLGEDWLCQIANDFHLYYEAPQCA